MATGTLGAEQAPERSLRGAGAEAPAKLASVALQPTKALFLISVLLPAVVYLLAILENRREVVRDAESRVLKTVTIVQEHALKVLETHQLVIDRVIDRLQWINWSDPAAVKELQQVLENLQELDQVATVTVTDADGHMRASSRMFPPNPRLSFAERDWYQALARDPSGVYISEPFVGRISGLRLFNVSRAYTSQGRFGGVVVGSVERAYLEKLYREIEPDYEHNVMLLRRDGAILARHPTTDQIYLPMNAPIRDWLRQPTAGPMHLRSSLDGTTLITANRQVGDYPVYVAYGLRLDSVMAPWRRNLWQYGLVAAAAAATLLALSWLVLREVDKQREVTRLLEQEIAARRQAELSLVHAQKMEALGQLTGGIAHDFNNLLTVVLGNLNLILRQPNLDQRLKRWAGSATESANRGVALIQQLLMFSRQQALAPKRVKLAALLGGMADLLRRTLGEDIVVETTVSGGLWPVSVDPNQLENALLNLAINARDAMPQGGRLRIELSNQRLAGDALPADMEPGEYVLIAVSDTGSGMDASVRERAFEPFFTTKPMGQGTGLGLSQVYGFVRQSGGMVRIDSTPGKGTRIELFLPHFVEDESVAEPPEPEAAPEPGHGETVLFVEDDDGARSYTSEVLEELGYIILPAPSGPAALEILEQRPMPDLLLTDIGLPGMNGKQLADRARAMHPTLKVLFTTGYDGKVLVRDGRLDPGVHLLQKPYTHLALAREIRAILDRSA